MSKEFVHLHSHTEYSMLDGAVRIPDLMQHVVDHGMKAVAITDHGNMFGAVEFYQAALEKGVQPIVGCEVYVAPGDRRDKKVDRSLGEEKAYHLLLLVQNETGYKNLCRLVTRAWFEGLYYKPRVDLELLREYNEGLIASSACLQGHVAKAILSNDRGKVRKTVQTFADIFPGRFYLELQENRVPEQTIVNEAKMGLAKEMGIPLVATNDNHYLCQGDHVKHDVLLAIGTGKQLDDPNRMRFPSEEFWVKPPEVMWEEFSYCPEALENTLRIAEQCRFAFTFGQNRLPGFAPDGEDIAEILDRETRKGFTRRIEEGGVNKEKMGEYKDRLEFELSVIKDMGFPGYFMVVSDFINWAKDRDIPIGPGRGSAAGSLVSYALRITDLDPLQYGLIFERFLNPGRKSMPDIDVDICKNGREEVIQYVIDRYGEEHVSQIATFNTLKAKRAVKDVGKAMGVNYSETDMLCKLIGNDLDVTLQSAYRDNVEFRKTIDGNEVYTEMFQTACELEGAVREQGIHAAGIVITDAPLTDYAPLYKGKKDERVLMYAKEAAEDLGLIKFDFLGLRNLTILQTAERLVHKVHGIKINFDTISLDDPQTYALLRRGEGLGVFQLESEGMCKLLRRLKPTCMDDLIAVLAIYRPGPLGSKMDDDFVDRKHGRKEVTYLLEGMDKILGETYGVLIYQEQIMQIAVDLGGFSKAEADDLRKAVSKKVDDKMAKALSDLKEGLVGNGHDPAKSQELCDLIQKFAAYGFNKSHSAAYAVVAYRTAWMKAHYPVEYMAALMTCQDNIEDVIKFINEVKRMKISVKAPDINGSDADFSVKDGAILFGLASIRNVGSKAVAALLKERDKNGSFSDVYDLFSRLDPGEWNRRMFEALIDSGAFDTFELSRTELHANLDSILAWVEDVHQERLTGQTSLFATGGGETPPPQWQEKEAESLDCILTRENQAIGLYMSGSPLDPFRRQIVRYTNGHAGQLLSMADRSGFRMAAVVQSVKARNGRKGRYAQVTCLDDYGIFELYIGVRLYEDDAVRSLLHEGQCIFATGMVATSDEEGTKPKLFVNELIDLADVEAHEAGQLHFSIPLNVLESQAIDRLACLVRQKPGNCRIVLHVEKENDFETVIELGQSYSVMPDAGFVANIHSIFPQTSRLEIH